MAGPPPAEPSPLLGEAVPAGDGYGSVQARGQLVPRILDAYRHGQQAGHGIDPGCYRGHASVEAYPGQGRGLEPGGSPGQDGSEFPLREQRPDHVVSTAADYQERIGSGHGPGPGPDPPDHTPERGLYYSGLAHG